MSLFKSGSKQHVETTTTEKPRRGGCLGFMKKWWWALLIVAGIIILVVLLIIFLVAIPKVIQHKVDDSELTIDGIAVTNTRTDAITISINSSISSSDSIHATIDGFLADLYLEDTEEKTPFASIQMPETKTGVSIVNVTQELPTNGANAAAFIQYNTWLLSNETLRMTVKGKTQVRPKGLKAHKVNFEKTVTINGLNGFKGLKVTSANISLTYDNRGDNFHGTADIPNPSIFTLEIGNATFGNYLGDSRIGALFIDNMKLVPGLNTVNVRANITQAPVLKAVTTQPYCASGIVAFDLIGESVINNGQDIPYFATALAAAKQTTEIDVGSALSVTFGAKVNKCP